MASASAIMLFSISACNKESTSDDATLNRWANDPDPCTKITAKYIIQSNRPWPNEQWTMTPEGAVLTKNDMWIGSQLFELSNNGRFLWPTEFLPKQHPLSATGIAGSVESVLKIPKLTFSDPNVGGTIYGQLICQIGQPREMWTENKEPQAKSSEALTKVIEAQLKANQKLKDTKISQLEGLHITEISAETQSGQRIYRYVPDNMKQRVANGLATYKPIECTERYGHNTTNKYDPSAKFDITSKCGTWVSIVPGAYIKFEVAQQYMPFIPALHDEMIKTLENSRRN